MGCWSESCALSGLEIGYDAPCYGALISPDFVEHEGHAFVVPPIRGVYDDYGGIYMTEESEIFGLKAGDNWKIRDDERGQRVYFHAGIVDKLHELTPEFDYRHKTLGGYWEAREEKLRTLVKSMTPLPEDASEKEKVAHFVKRIGVSDSFGHRDLLKDENILFADIIDGRHPGTIEEFITLYKRVFLLKRADSELRRMIVSGVTGPQHNGGEALKQMCQWIIEEIEADQEEQE